MLCVMHPHQNWYPEISAALSLSWAIILGRSLTKLTIPIDHAVTNIKLHLRGQDISPPDYSEMALCQLSAGFVNNLILTSVRPPSSRLSSATNLVRIGVCVIGKQLPLALETWWGEKWSLQFLPALNRNICSLGAFCWLGLQGMHAGGG